MTSFAWNFRAYDRADPNEVGAEVAAITDRDGRLSPEAVVEAASDPTSAMHVLFEWDDTEAARKYRLDQARGMIRNLRVVVDGDPQPVTRRVFVHVSGSKSPGYRTIDAVAQDKELSAKVIADAHADLLAWQSRFDELLSSLPLLKKRVDGVLEELRKSHEAAA